MFEVMMMGKFMILSKPDTFLSVKFLVIVVENQVVESYEDIVQLIDQDCFKEKELLEVKFLPIIVRG